MWCWRRMEISWIDYERHKKVLRRVKEERNILHTIKRDADWIRYILRKNCLLEQVIAGKM
jgi:replicative superfamily II helicase